MAEPKEFTRYLKKVTDEDIVQLEEVLRQNPSDLDVLDWLAFALYSAGRFQRASELYERCVSLDPGAPSFHYFLGNCYYRMDDRPKAAAEWNRVLEIDSEGKFRSKAAEKLRLLD